MMQNMHAELQGEMKRVQQLHSLSYLANQYNYVNFVNKL